MTNRMIFIFFTLFVICSNEIHSMVNLKNLFNRTKSRFFRTKTTKKTKQKRSFSQNMQKKFNMKYKKPGITMAVAGLGSYAWWKEIKNWWYGSEQDIPNWNEVRDSDKKEDKNIQRRFLSHDNEYSTENIVKKYGTNLNVTQEKAVDLLRTAMNEDFNQTLILYNDIPKRLVLLYLLNNYVVRQKFQKNVKDENIQSSEIILKSSPNDHGVKFSEGPKPLVPDLYISQWKPFLFNGTDDNPFVRAINDQEELKTKGLLHEYSIARQIAHNLNIETSEMSKFYNNLIEIAIKHGALEVDILKLYQPYTRTADSSIKNLRKNLTYWDPYIQEQLTAKGIYIPPENKKEANVWWSEIYFNRPIRDNNYKLIANDPIEYFRKVKMVVRIPEGKLTTGKVTLIDLHDTQKLYDDVVQKEFEKVIEKYTKK